MEEEKKRLLGEQIESEQKKLDKIEKDIQEITEEIEKK